MTAWSTSRLTGRPVLGVLPYLARTWLDAEDAMAAEGPYGDQDSASAVARLGSP
jgi:adenosylcobyric acid synthase